MKIQVMSPMADKIDNRFSPARRLDTLNGKTIGVYQNQEGGSAVAAARIGQKLQERYPGLKIEKYGGPVRAGRAPLSRGIHIDPDEAVVIAKEVDAVVGATAH